MKTRRNSAAFTLIEIMVVVVILGILASIIVPQIIKRPDEARLVKARQDVLSLQNAMDLYKLDNGAYPTTDQGIAALVTKPTIEPIPKTWEPYLKSLPQDPWNRPYQYLNPGQHGDIDIYSRGPDGAKPDDVIGNWDVKAEKPE